MDSELVAEQLMRTIDNLKADITINELSSMHESAILENRIIKLEECKKDHETRIRNMQSGVVSFKVWSGLSNASAVVLSILALFRSLIGG